MAEDYTEALFKSIDTIVNERIKNLPYDRTIVATITNNDNATTGKYEVTTDTAIRFTAYSSNPNYNKNERVYVRIPEGDYTQQKVITDRYVARQGEEFGSGKTIFFKDSTKTNQTTSVPTSKIVTITGTSENNTLKGYEALSITLNKTLDNVIIILQGTNIANINHPKEKEFEPRNFREGEAQVYLLDDINPYRISISQQVTGLSMVLSFGYVYSYDAIGSLVLYLYNNDDHHKYYSPDAETVTNDLNAKLLLLSGNSETKNYLATPQAHDEIELYLYDEAQELQYNEVLKGNFIKQDGFTVQFYPYQQTTGQLIYCRAYTKTARRTIISNLYYFYSRAQLSRESNKFTIETPNQFYVYGPDDIILLSTSNNLFNLYIHYQNILVDAETLESVAQPIVTQIGSNITALTYVNKEDNEKTFHYTFRLNQTLQKLPYQQDKLIFTITKDNIIYTLSQEFYFGYQNIGRTEADGSSLILGGQAPLKLLAKTKTADGNKELFSLSGNDLQLGGKALTITSAGANWAGNAATATTAKYLDATPELANNNKKIKITVGGQTSNELTVAFATEATELTNKPSLSNDNNQLKITAGGKTSDGLTIAFATNATNSTNATNATNATKLTTNAGSATRPVYFSNGIPVVTDQITISSTSGNSYDIINTLNKIIAALNTNVAAVDGRTIWQGITI